MAQDASGSHKLTQYLSSYSLASRKTQETCQCPACQGLQCLERPRYFAGQLLTEAELNSEQAYVIAKNRLHNRYLHGWGVVCGLDVVCHNCEGWVSVHAGYALDPCGNDVIVCRDTELNVLEAIQKCIDAKRRREDDCPPWKDPNDNCVDDEQHWCITLQYVENEARAVMPLMESKSHCGCGNKCGGGCDCGKKKNGSGNGCSCGDKPKASAKKVACEPTRIFEQYRLGVVPEPESCARKRKKEIQLTEVIESGRDKTYLAGFGGFTIADFLPAGIAKHPLLALLVAAAPDESILKRALHGAQDVMQFFLGRFTLEELGMLLAAFRRCSRTRDGKATKENPGSDNEVNAEPQDDHLYALCCRLRRALRDLYAANPLNVRCVPFDCPPCSETTPPPPDSTQPPGNTTPGGGSQLDSLCCLFDALLNYIVDGICMLFLPPCPPQPCEDRVILACVTIKDGKIVHICNHACRHYAGSFNSVEHWLSAVPMISLIGRLLREVCCSDDVLDTFKKLALLMKRKKLEP